MAYLILDMSPTCHTTNWSFASWIFKVILETFSLDLLFVMSPFLYVNLLKKKKKTHQCLIRIIVQPYLWGSIPSESNWSRLSVLWVSPWALQNSRLLFRKKRKWIWTSLWAFWSIWVEMMTSCLSSVFLYSPKYKATRGRSEKTGI